MTKIQKKAETSFSFSLFCIVFLILVLKEVLNGLVGNHLLVEDVSTSLGALYHLDNLCVSVATVFFAML